MFSKCLAISVPQFHRKREYRKICFWHTHTNATPLYPVRCRCRRWKKLFATPFRRAHKHPHADTKEIAIKPKCYLNIEEQTHFLSIERRLNAHLMGTSSACAPLPNTHNRTRWSIAPPRLPAKNKKNDGQDKKGGTPNRRIYTPGMHANFRACDSRMHINMDAGFSFTV